MTAGMRVRGSNGKFQIDGTHPVYFFSHWGRINVVNPSGDDTGRELWIKINDEEIVFYRGRHLVMFEGFRRSGNDNFVIVSVPDNFGDTHVDYWVYAKCSALPPTRHAGLRIRSNTTGEPIFDSGMKPLKLIKSFYNKRDWEINGMENRGQNIAACIISKSGQNVGGNKFAPASVVTTGNGLRFECGYGREIWRTRRSYVKDRHSVLFADVTGH